MRVAWSPERVRLCVAPPGRIGERVGGGDEAFNTRAGRKAEPTDAPPLPCASAAVSRLSDAAAGRAAAGRAAAGREVGPRGGGREVVAREAAARREAWVG